MNTQTPKQDIKPKDIEKAASIFEKIAAALRALLRIFR